MATAVTAGPPSAPDATTASSSSAVPDVVINVPVAEERKVRCTADVCAEDCPHKSKRALLDAYKAHTAALAKLLGPPMAIGQPLRSTEQTVSDASMNMAVARRDRLAAELAAHLV
jgi:hypothetical protein